MKRYLGDGVYAAPHQLGIELTTENGIEVQNRIVLEPDVFLALLVFARRQMKWSFPGGAE